MNRFVFKVLKILNKSTPFLSENFTSPLISRTGEICVTCNRQVRIFSAIFSDKIAFSVLPPYRVFRQVPIIWLVPVLKNISHTPIWYDILYLVYRITTFIPNEYDVDTKSMRAGGG